jgi:tetratricopeptide (TPR) repeat protein
MQCLLKISMLAAFAAPTLYAQGWGLVSKKVVTIGRILPASVNLNKKRIAVESSVEAGVQEAGAKNLPALLKTKLVTMIQHDPRLIIEEVHPGTALRFKVTNYYTEKWTVGDAQNHHEEWRGKLEVAYQAVELSNGVVLDSENLQVAIGYEPTNLSSRPSSFPDINIFKNPGSSNGGGKPSENVCKDALIDGIVRAMGKRVAPVEEPFEAILPTKKLEPLSALAVSHRWGTLEQQADKFEKFPKPDDDTYRVYLIALAKEAQAYDLAREANEREMGKRPEIPEAEARAQFKQAQKFMDEARELYKQIVEANPKERNFRPGDTRTEEAIKIYAEIERNWGQRQAAPSTSTSGGTQTVAQTGGRAAGEPAPDNNASQAKVMSPLDRVLEFCRVGVDQAGITDYINSPDFLADAKATNYKFNFGTDMLALKNSCMANASAYQKLMRSRLDGGPPVPVPAAAPAPAPAPAPTRPVRTLPH